MPKNLLPFNSDDEPEHRKAGDIWQPSDREKAEPDDGVPTEYAEVHIELEGVKIRAKLRGWVAWMFMAVIGTPLTLHFLPESFPVWASLGVVLAQLALEGYVVQVFGRQRKRRR